MNKLHVHFALYHIKFKNYTIQFSVPVYMLFLNQEKPLSYPCYQQRSIFAIPDNITQLKNGLSTRWPHYKSDIIMTSILIQPPSPWADSVTSLYMQNTKLPDRFTSCKNTRGGIYNGNMIGCFYTLPPPNSCTCFTSVGQNSTTEQMKSLYYRSLKRLQVQSRQRGV